MANEPPANFKRGVIIMPLGANDDTPDARAFTLVTGAVGTGSTQQSVTTNQSQSAICECSYIKTDCTAPLSQENPDG